MIKLKPCPFCGGKADFATWIFEGGKKEYSVMCDDCDADVYSCETKEEAAEKWNRRDFE